MQTQPAPKSKFSPEELEYLIGTDLICQWLVDNNMPLTLENWMEIAHPGKTLDELHPEHRAEVPELLLERRD